MPTFDTPEPISVTLEVGVGDIRIVASDRTDTIVDVRPSDPAKRSDVTAAEQTRVEYAKGRVLVKAPKGWRQWSFRGGGESIDVEIGVPAGSQVVGESSGVAGLRCTGRIGECRYKVGVGDIRIEEAGPLRPQDPVPAISAVERAVGDAQITTGSGAVVIGSVNGAAEVKNSNGDTRIEEVTGDAAREGGQRQDLHRPSERGGDREDRERRRPPRRGRAWCRRRRDRVRHGRGRCPRRRPGLAGPQHAVRQRSERPGGLLIVPSRGRTRLTSAPAPPSATSPSGVPSRTPPGRGRHDHGADRAAALSRAREAEGPPSCPGTLGVRICNSGDPAGWPSG